MCLLKRSEYRSNSMSLTHRHLAFLVATKEDSRNGESHLYFTVITQDFLRASEEDLLKRYRPEDSDDSMSFAEPCHEIVTLFFASGLHGALYDVKLKDTICSYGLRVRVVSVIPTGRDVRHCRIEPCCIPSTSNTTNTSASTFDSLSFVFRLHR